MQTAHSSGREEKCFPQIGTHFRWGEIDDILNAIRESFRCAGIGDLLAESMASVDLNTPEICIRLPQSINTQEFILLHHALQNRGWDTDEDVASQLFSATVKITRRFNPEGKAETPQAVYVPTPNDVRTRRDDEAQKLLDAGRVNDVLESIVSSLQSATLNGSIRLPVRQLSGAEFRAINKRLESSGWTVFWRRNPNQPSFLIIAPG